jgi:hypothetical protein
LEAARHLALDTGMPVYFQLVDHLFNAFEPLERLLSHLLLEERRNTTVQHHDPTFFLTKDLVTVQVWVPLDGRVDSMTKFSLRSSVSFFDW